MPPKRKVDLPQPGSTKRLRFSRFQDARTIATQTPGKALANGELDVDKFVKAREFEIKALEQGMQSAHKLLSTRAFQGVPRELRRRTASHNVKRVPRRLQSRAKREMAEDNTPTVSSKTRKPTGKTRLRQQVAKQKRASKAPIQSKASRNAGNVVTKEDDTQRVAIRVPHVKNFKLSKPPRHKSKFRKRQIDKTWLPTHLFHTKRALMTPSAEPLWGTTIPLTPTQKSYRPTHRAGTARGAMAWDMSYMSTLQLTGTQDTISAVLQGLGVGADSDGSAWWQTVRASRFTAGARSWSGWVHKSLGPSTKPIGPVLIIWDRYDANATVQKPSRPVKRRALIRIHPSAFLQLWEHVIVISKIQRPTVAVQDLRYDIGSIEVMGPASTEALVGVLWPSSEDKEDSEQNESCPAFFWRHLKGITNPAMLPADVMLPLQVSDPRLHYPPRSMDLDLDEVERSNLMNILTKWPADQSPTATSLFDPTVRLRAERCLPSQKTVNQRKGAAIPGAYPEALPQDPSIPVLLLPGKMPSTGCQGTWTLLLPRRCVLPVWYCLMHYPLAGGGTVRFGGLHEKRQLAYEAAMPWFPGDFPGTDAGKNWEEQERAKRKKEWEKRPKSKRVSWESVDLGQGRRGELGRGWACDWETLSGRGDTDTSSVELLQVDAREARMRLKRVQQDDSRCERPLLLATVHITMLRKGVATACARVYRLPSNNPRLYDEWITLARAAKGSDKSTSNGLLQTRRQNSMSEHLHRQRLAASLLGDPAEMMHDQGSEPAVPDAEDLIGFVTTGNFNLSEGVGASIGSIAVDKVQGLEHGLCIVRESGHGNGRLARWELA